MTTDRKLPAGQIKVTDTASYAECQHDLEDIRAALQHLEVGADHG